MIGDGASPRRTYVSTDGAAWRALQNDAACGERYKSADASFRGLLWRVGGFEVRGENRTYFNDVWRSDDGVRWLRVLDSAPWYARADARLVPFRDSLWLIGGDPADDTAWSTSDGVTWIAHRATGLPSGAAQGMVAFQGALWWVGTGQWEQATNDVWTSRDGRTWTRVVGDGRWSARNVSGRRRRKR